MEKDKVTGSQDPVTSEEQSSYAEKEQEQNQNQDVENASEEGKTAEDIEAKKVEPEESDKEEVVDSATEKSSEKESTDSEQTPQESTEELEEEEVKLIAEESKISEENPIKEELIVVQEETDNKEEVKSSEDSDDKKEESSTEDKEEEAKESDVSDEGGEEEYENLDFSTMSKEELIEVVKMLGKDDNPFKADKILRQITPFFNKIREEDRKVALDKFIEDGGDPEDFQYQPDELSLRFDANYKLIKDKKSKKHKEQDKERANNLKLAEDVLEELREFVDSEESSGSFNQFKNIQQKWKDIGDVPPQNSRTLWANYNALVHRFYDQRSIYFELKELDRKKNYESKIKLCEKAEELENVKNLREAIKGLNDLHHEFKHIGPVPQDVQEELWQRFKAASDKVYKRRKVFVQELKTELNENLDKKIELIEKVKSFVDFNSDRIKDWNDKTKELLAIQKEWEAIGGLPKDKAKKINKDFWSSFKKFFSNKHQFFKKLEADRDTNLEKKEALLQKALELKESEDWDKTANELKKLQQQWREIGPVPEKKRKKVYQDFKEACDHFFERRRAGFKNAQEVYKENLVKKKEIIEKIKKLSEKADDKLEEFNKLRTEFLEIGYVPKKNIQSIKNEFQQIVEEFLNKLTVINEKQKAEISLEAEFTDLAGSEHSEQELYHKEQAVRRQINKLEDDIALWQNNLEFFAHSKSTDKLRKEVNTKIDKAKIQLNGLKRQLKMLRSL